MKDYIDKLINQVLEFYGDDIEEDDVIAEVMYQLELVFVKDEEDDGGFFENFVFEPWEIEEYYAYERYRKEMSRLPFFESSQ